MSALAVAVVLITSTAALVSAVGAVGAWRETAQIRAASRRPQIAMKGIALRQFGLPNCGVSFRNVGPIVVRDVLVTVMGADGVWGTGHAEDGFLEVGQLLYAFVAESTVPNDGRSIATVSCIDLDDGVHAWSSSGEHRDYGPSKNQTAPAMTNHVLQDFFTDVDTRPESQRDLLFSIDVTAAVSALRAS
jgi:hypothetical protein